VPCRKGLYDCRIRIKSKEKLQTIAIRPSMLYVVQYWPILDSINAHDLSPRDSHPILESRDTHPIRNTSDREIR
jgi:hypothetical protein